MADERPLPTRIWSVDDYYRVKDFYGARGLVFNPALEHGSPAEYHVRTQAQLQRDRGDAIPPVSDPRVAELLLLLWDAPDREAGIAVVKLPDRLRTAELLTACEGGQLVQFARRNHCWHGGGARRKLVLEPGWTVAELHKPGRKQAWQVLQEAIAEDVPDEIRYRVQLSYRGTAEVGRMALARRAPGDASAASNANLAIDSNAAASHGEPAEVLPVPPSGFLGGADLAIALGVHESQRNAFSKQLERERPKLVESCMIEAANRRRNAPQFLYLVSAPAIQSLAAAYRQPKRD